MRLVYVIIFLPPVNEVSEGHVFTPVCQSFCSQRWGLHSGGSASSGVCSQWGSASRGVGKTPFPHRILVMGYGQRVGSTHPTGMAFLFGISFNNKTRVYRLCSYSSFFTFSTKLSDISDRPMANPRITSKRA